MKKILIILTSVSLWWVLGCSREDHSGWFLDTSFSLQLVSSWGKPAPVISQQDPATAVDALQIFRTPEEEESLSTLTEIRSQELVYETNNSADIIRFFRAARERTKERCASAGARFVFFILAFDRDLMRIGVLKYYPCTREDLGSFQTWGANSLYFSSEFSSMMNKMIPSSIQRGNKR